MPLKAIGDDLQKTIVELDKTLDSAPRATLDNADKLIAPNSVLGQELGNHAAGGEPRGAQPARAGRLPRAPSRGAHPWKTGEAK